MNDDWNYTLQGDFLWSSTNFGEAIPSVMTPLTWSVIRFTLAEWVFLPGYETVGNVGGRPYINISLFATLFQGMGKQRQDLLEALESNLYLRLPVGLDIPTLSEPRRRFLSALPCLARLQAGMLRGSWRLPAYLAGSLEWFERVRQRILAADAPALLALWRDEISPHLKQGVWCVFGTINHSTDYTLQLRRDLTALVGAEDAHHLIANLSRDGAELASLGLLAGLTRVARGELSRAAYLQTYGHRGADEFELSLPRPFEDPAWLDQELARLRAAPQSYELQLAAQRCAFDAAWQRLQASHPRRAAAFRRRLDESAHWGRQRELARSAYVRDRWSVRLFALRAAQLIGLHDELFFLTLDELLSSLAGAALPAASLAQRQEAYLRYKALPAYPALIRGRFDPAAWAADPHRRTDFFAPHSSPLPQAALQPILRGSPASAGRVEGRVRLLRSPAEGDRLRPGEILLAVQTDVAWSLLFPLAAAVITDVGAPLSHAAILARELGIPAVVGCGDATLRLKTGDLVRVDGANGLVEILS